MVGASLPTLGSAIWPPCSPLSGDTYGLPSLQIRFARRRRDPLACCDMCCAGYRPELRRLRSPDCSARRLGRDQPLDMWHLAPLLRCLWLCRCCLTLSTAISTTVHLRFRQLSSRQAPPLQRPYVPSRQDPRLEPTWRSPATTCATACSSRFVSRRSGQ